MKAQKVRELSAQEREDKVKDLQEELFTLKFQAATGKIQNPGRIKHARREIARIKSIQNETRPPEETPAGAKEEAKA